MTAGISEVTPAFNVVKEYLDRKKLCELGFRFDGDVLDSVTAEKMIAVADEMIKAERDVLPKLKNPTGAKNGGRNTNGRAPNPRKT
jgi:hypothetical protein